MPSGELEFRGIDFEPAEIPAWRRSAAEDGLKSPWRSSGGGSAAAQGATH